MNTAVVFTGQGSQRIGMGEDFYNTYDSVKKNFEDASNAIQVDIAKLCFTENQDINLTEYTQPCLLTLEIAIHNVLQENYNFQAQYFGGHSLGEYSALVASGTISFIDAVKIVRQRGILMQGVSKQGDFLMGAIIHPGLSNIGYQAILEENNVEVANINSPQQVVVSGLRKDIEKLDNIFKDNMPEVNFVILNVSSPFHSSHMKSIELEFEDHLKSFMDKINSHKSQRVLSNYTGDFHQPKCLISHLVKQAIAPVKWVDNMNLLTTVSDTIYEIGPNKILSKFFKAINSDISSIINIRSMNKAFS